MREETVTALKNLQWMYENRDDVALHWDTETIVYGDGGAHISVLTEKGFTPATS